MKVKTGVQNNIIFIPESDYDIFSLGRLVEKSKGGFGSSFQNDKLKDVFIDGLDIVDILFKKLDA